MAILLKDGVTIGLSPAGFRILEAAKQVSKAMRRDFTITSGTDGDHSGPTDPHKTAEAYDFRSNTLNTSQKAEFLTRVRGLLSTRFFCFLENPGADNEHIHCQRAKNTTYSITDYLSDS